jgi:hypothetical protein
VAFGVDIDPGVEYLKINQNQMIEFFKKLRPFLLIMALLLT